MIGLVFYTILVVSNFFGPTFAISFCNETKNVKNGNIQLCKESETYCPVCPPNPKDWPTKINPIIDFKDVLDVNEEKKSVTILINLIMIWNVTSLNHTG